MNIKRFEQKECERMRGYLDSYMSNELLVETNHEVLDHLNSCGGCSEALQARLRIKGLLRDALAKDEAPVGLQYKIHKSIRRESSNRWARFPLVAAAALVLMLAALGGLRVWNTYHARENLLSAADRRKAQVLNVGLSDHVHCTVNLGYANMKFTDEEMSERLGPEYRGLVPVVRERMAGGYRVAIGHVCRFNKREFVHLILKSDHDIASLIITKKNGESFPSEGVAAVLEASGTPLYRSNIENFEVAGFETAGYLAFVVSDMQERDNLEMLARVGPPVRDYLTRLDGPPVSARGRAGGPSFMTIALRMP